MGSLSRKSAVSLALQSLALVSGSQEYRRAYGLLYQRATKIQKQGKALSVKALLAKPLTSRVTSRGPTRSTLEVSSLVELFKEESALAEQLEAKRKEIQDVLKRSISEARRRKIPVERLIEGYGLAVGKNDEAGD